MTKLENYEGLTIEDVAVRYYPAAMVYPARFFTNGDAIEILEINDRIMAQFRYCVQNDTYEIISIDRSLNEQLQDELVEYVNYYNNGGND